MRKEIPEINVLEHRWKILPTVENYAVDYMIEQTPDEGKFPPLCVRMIDYAAAQIAYLYIELSAKYGCAIRVSANPSERIWRYPVAFSLEANRRVSTG